MVNPGLGTPENEDAIEHQQPHYDDQECRSRRPRHYHTRTVHLTDANDYPTHLPPRRGQKLQKGDRGRGPSRRPRTGKSSGTPHCPKTHGPSSIGRHKQVWERRDGRHVEKTNSIPARQKLTPPGQISKKFEIEANRMSWGPKRAK